jgi:hypothetical protein
MLYIFLELREHGKQAQRLLLRYAKSLIPWTKELKDTNPLMSSLLVICLGWFSNFVGSESGQKERLKLLQNMVYTIIQHPPIPPPPVTHTVRIYSTFTLGGGGEVREKVR